MLFLFLKQKTAYEMRISAWSSDVCSSDLGAPARLHQPRRRPAAGDAADVGQQVDRGERQAEGRQIHIVALEQITGQPEQEEPPDRIDEELAERIGPGLADRRSEEHTSELQSLMRISYAVFCLKKKNQNKNKLKI